MVKRDIACLGGRVWITEQTSSQVYNISTDTWTEFPSIPGAPTVDYNQFVAHEDGQLYALGGRAGDSRFQTAYAYDPSTATWTQKSSMSHDHENFGAASTGGYIYVAGGYNHAVVERFDPTNNAWETLSSLPAANFGHKLAALGGYIYSVGGGEWNAASAASYRYDETTDTWITMASMSTGRYLVAVASFEM